jgi:hypothetical protein
MSVASVLLAAVLAVFFSAIGGAKILAVPSMRERATHTGYSVAAYRGIGFAEIAGALGLLLGIVHVRIGDGVREFAPAIVGCLVAVVYLVTLLGAAR